VKLVVYSAVFFVILRLSMLPINGSDPSAFAPTVPRVEVKLSLLNADETNTPSINNLNVVPCLLTATCAQVPRLMFRAFTSKKPFAYQKADVLPVFKPTIKELGVVITAERVENIAL
jgi:hypothetical protein